MTIEQKAKKYDEALEWMRELYPGLHGATKEDAEHYFPELIKDEDERMRKGIIDVIQRAGFISSESKYKAIAWLEKQKEIPKSADSIPSDCVTDAKCEDRSPKHNISVDEIAQDYIDGVKEYNPEPTWDLMQTAVCYGYNYCEQKEQKPEWSEEDEKMIDHLIEALPMWATGRIAMLPSQADEYVKRLKSLRPQPKQEWKEQKPEAKLTGWVARDSCNEDDCGLFAYKNKPFRASFFWVDEYSLDTIKFPWKAFPDLKWEDEPVEVEVTIRRK